MAKQEVRFFARKKRKKPATYRRKKKKPFLKWLAVFVVAQIVMYVYIVEKVSMEYDRNSQAKTNGIYITAAHLSEEFVGKRYKLMYYDKKTDTAYYLDTEYVGPRHHAQTVKIAGTSGGSISASEKGSFTVTLNNTEEVVAGLSGQRVYNKDKTVVLGFVSSMLPGGKLHCISLE